MFVYSVDTCTYYTIVHISRTNNNIRMVRALCETSRFTHLHAIHLRWKCSTSDIQRYLCAMYEREFVVVFSSHLIRTGCWMRNTNVQTTPNMIANNQKITHPHIILISTHARLLVCCYFHLFQICYDIFFFYCILESHWLLRIRLTFGKWLLISLRILFLFCSYCDYQNYWK